MKWVTGTFQWGTNPGTMITVFTGRTHWWNWSDINWLRLPHSNLSVTLLKREWPGWTFLFVIHQWFYNWRWKKENMLKNHKDSHNLSGTSPSPQDQSGQNDASNDWQIFKTRCQPVTKDHHVSCCAVCWFPNFKLEFQNHLYNSFICNRDKGTPATAQAPPVGLVQNY